VSGERATIERAVDSLSLPVAVVDATGKSVETSAAWERFLDDAGLVGTARSIATNYLDALENDGASPDTDLQRGVGAALESGADRITVRLAPHATDHGRSVRLRIAPIEGVNGRYAALTPIGESPDEAGLGDGSGSLGLKERTMDEAPVGITISDPSVPDNPMIYANRSFVRLTGYPIEEVLGRNCRFLQGPGTDEADVDRMREAIASERDVTVVVRNYRQTGESFWNEVTIAPIRADGEVSHFVGFQSDVTDREEAKRELATERDQFALLNQLVRHDIGNDMTVILGWAEALEEHVPPEGRDHLEAILHAATHANELTAAARDLAEIVEADEPPLEPVALAPILEREIDRVRSNFDYRVDSLSVRTDGAVPEVDVLATSLLSSVFSNLLDNAIFHNDGADVVIDVGVDVGNDHVVVRIADDGRGISDDRKREVFGRGEKGLESTGSGLGLYLVDRLVDIYGGRVWIEDNEPRGAVFCVKLQRAGAEA